MKKKNVKYLILIIVFICVIAGIILTKKFFLVPSLKIKIDKLLQNFEKPENAVLIKEKPLSIYNEKGRNVAVMISNEKAAWPQAGLQNAYMIYECIIEGGETRFMALFNKDKLPDKIGPVRSSRHYFLDYINEHNAVYSHFGWSPLAEERIKQRRVQNINGIYDNYFWREGAGYNNAFISKKTILDFANKKGYSLEQNTKFPFNITSKNVEIENGNSCNYLKLRYSGRHYVEYNYDANNKVYYRSMRGQKHVDRVTKEQIYAKNIIVMKVKNFNLNDYKNSARQDMNNIGSGEGYYITNGKYEKITWNKSSYNSKTIIKNLSGEEITLNDGLTFMQIVPINYDVVLN